jgi:hypothetical protein
MKRLWLGIFCLLLSASALAAGPGAVRKRVQASMLLTGKIVVAPDGSVRSYAIDQQEKVPPAVMGLIKKSLPRWRFEPTLLNGDPVAAEAKMSFRVVAKPVDDDNFSISISGAQFGTRNPSESISYKKRVQPRYPMQAVEARASGTVYLAVRVGQQGQVLDVSAEQVNMTVLGNDTQLERWRKVLANAAMSAARRWTFNLPTSGKYIHADYWVAMVPVRFSMTRQVESGYGQWESYVPGPRQPIPWFDKDTMLSASPDAVPGDGLHQFGQGPQLTTPLGGG